MGSEVLRVVATTVKYSSRTMRWDIWVQEVVAVMTNDCRVLTALPGL